MFEPACFASSGSGSTLVSQADAAFNAAVGYAATHDGAVVDLGPFQWNVCNDQQGWTLPHSQAVYGGEGVSIFGEGSRVSQLNLTCQVHRTVLPNGNQGAISQAFLWEPTPKAATNTAYYDHDFYVDAAGLATYVVDLEGTTYVSTFEHMSLAGAVGDGSSKSAYFRIGNSAYPSQATAFQVTLKSVEINAGAKAGSGATLTVAIVSGSPVVTVAAQGAGYGSHTEVFLNGNAGGTRSQPCTTMGTLTASTASGKMTAVKASGFSGCTGAIYALAYDPIHATKYGLYLDNYTDSYTSDIQSNAGAVAAVFLNGSSDVMVKFHGCCGMPFSVIDNGTNTWIAPEFDSPGSFGMSFTGNSSSTVVGANSYWNGAYPGSGTYLFGPGVTGVKLMGGNCTNSQSAGGYNLVTSLGGPGLGKLSYAINMVAETDCSTTQGVNYIPSLTVQGGLKGAYVAQVPGQPIASAPSISLVNGMTHITGTAAIATITPPATGCYTLIADSAWKTIGGGNIQAPMTATANTAYQDCYDGKTNYIK